MAVPRPRTQIHPVMHPPQTLSPPRLPPVETGRREDAQKGNSYTLKLRVPSSSSGPQRPQLLRVVIQPSTSSSVGIGMAISLPPSLAGLGKRKVPLLGQRPLWSVSAAHVS